MLQGGASVNPMHSGSVILLLVVPFVALFGDINFNPPGRFGLGTGAFVVLCVLWLAGSAGALVTANQAGARTGQIWMLVILSLVCVGLAGAAAA